MASTDATPFPVKNQAYRVTFPILDADGDLVSGATALDSEVSKDGGTFADCTNEATEIATSSGVYFLDLTATEMNADTVAVIVKTTSTGAKTTVLVLYPQADGLDRNVNVTHWNGTAVATPATAGYPAVTIKSGTGTGEVSLSSGTVTVGTNNDKTGYSLTATTGLGDQTANITGNLSGSVGSVTGAVGSVTGNVGGNVTGSVGSVAAGGITAASIATGAVDADALAADAVAEIADGVWDEVINASTHNVGSSAGQRLRQLSSAIVTEGTATAGAATSITLAVGSSAIDNYYNFDVISIVGGTGAGQSRLIVAYNGTTRVATVYRAWATNPDATSEYVIQAQTELLIRNSGLAQAGANNSITLATTASGIDDEYIGSSVLILAGTGEGQLRVITDYNGTTKVASVTDAWAANPDTTSVYAVLPLGRSYVVDIDADSLAKINAEVDTAISDALPISANVTQISGSAAAADQLELNVEASLAGTASGTPSTTSMVSDIAVTVDDQFKGRIIIFQSDTTTAALRNQATDITACTASSNTLTFTALTTAPSSGDTFIIV